MDLGLKGRVAIIGGGSKGLGRACADSLAQEGADLVICSRNSQELGQAAGRSAKRLGSRCWLFPVTLANCRMSRDWLKELSTTLDGWTS